MIVIGTQAERYQLWRYSKTTGIYNGAYYYAKEIEDIILPAIDREIYIVTVGGTLQTRKSIPNGAVVVCHNNQNPAGAYMNLFGKDILWICSKESTVPKLTAHGENAVYVPLSIDTEYVSKFKTKKTKDMAFVGNRWGFKEAYLDSLPDNIDQLSGMERTDLLREMAKYKRVIAEGRCLMEALVLGCKGEIPEYNDSKLGAIYREPLDSRDAIPYWREALANHPQMVRVRATRRFIDVRADIVRKKDSVFMATELRVQEIISKKPDLIEVL